MQLELVQNVALHCITCINWDVSEKMPKHVCTFKNESDFTDVQVTHATGTNTPRQNSFTRKTTFSKWMLSLIVTECSFISDHDTSPATI